MSHDQPTVIVDSGASYMGLTANELANKLLENNAVSWGDCTYEQHYNDNYFKTEAATMLRQQHAEIEALKAKYKQEFEYVEKKFSDEWWQGVAEYNKEKAQEK